MRRAAAGGLAMAAALAAWPGAAPAQNSGPIPYTQLVGREHPAPRKPKPHPKAVVRPPPASGAPGAAGIAGASASGSAGPPLAAPSQGPVGRLPPPTAATTPSGTAVPGAPSRPAASPAPPPPVPPAELPFVAATEATPVPGGARLAPGVALPPAEVEAFVDGMVRQAGAERPLAGVAVAVVQGGQVVMERGYGAARPGVAVDPRTTVFRLGSVSKVFTWIEVLKAVEAGRLRLDDPVNAHLPRALAVPDDGFRTPVRLRNLMTHDAGFESREFGRLFRTDPADVRPLEQTLAAERPHRVRAPGDMPTYSNYGAALAGALAAGVAGKPFDRLLDDDLLRPAGMLHTGFGEPRKAREGLPAPMPPALAAQLAQGYAWTRHGLRPEPFGYAGGWAPALSASSTADDMARFMLAYLAGGRAVGTGAALWGPRTEAALRTPLTPGWAHGLMVYDLPGGFRGFGHDGSTPGFRAKLVLAPQLNLGVFVAGASDTSERLTASLPELLVRRFYAGPPATATPGALPDAQDYAGSYVSTRRTYHGLEGFVDRLTRLFTVRSEGDGALVVWGPGGGRRWLGTGERGRLVAADGTGAPLTFLFDAAGRPRAFLDPAGQWGAERVDPLHRPATLALAAGVAELASLLVLAGLFVRDAREYRQSDRQRTASRLQSFTALLWLTALGLFAAFALTGVREGLLQRRWPDAWLVGASCCALGATLLTLAQVFQLPGAWSSARRVQGWSAWRKLRHTATVAVFAAFGFVLLGWGALEPWSS